MRGAVVGIEVKIADNWSVAQLEEALERQLAGQYLRDARSRHGVLLLVRAGKKVRWGRGAAGATFDAVVGRLSERAATLSASGAFQVRVVAIDCSAGP